MTGGLCGCVGCVMVGCGVGVEEDMSVWDADTRQLKTNANQIF